MSAHPYAGVEAALREKVAVSLGRRRKAARHADAGAGELADHFAKRRILAADLLDVIHAQLFKVDDEGLHTDSFQGGQIKK